MLVNGRRYIPKDQTGVSDLNAIPVALIERTEVITGGASAVYGSDALAGVINFILKKDFEGVQFDAQYGQSKESDGNTTDLSMIVGTNFDRGNVTAYAGYTKRDAIYNGDRSYSRVAQFSDTRCGWQHHPRQARRGRISQRDPDEYPAEQSRL